jgi:light-regulated signal transduction histidine kinase (bacteriophytochrome)
VLRSVSPIHVEYLANMGARASMSISVVVRGRLWGLVTCLNHSGPRLVSYEIRTACETIGRLVSLQIAGLDDRERAELRKLRSTTREALADAMLHTPNHDDVLWALIARPEALLALVDAEGAAVLGEGSPRMCGRTPLYPLLVEIESWLDERGVRAPFATNSLASHFPPATDAKDVASGLLTIALPGAPRRRVIWFRPEVVQTVFWGGNPHEPAEVGLCARIHPRRSFQKWKEEVRLKARPWTVSDVEAAEELRRSAIEIDLARQLERARRAVHVRDDLMAVVSHDLRTPLNVVQLQTSLLLRSTAEDAGEPARRLHASAERIQHAVTRMNSLITDLLDIARIEAGRVELRHRRTHVPDLIDDSLIILRPLAEAKHIVLVEKYRDSYTVCVDRERIFQVLANILGNAIRYTPEGGSITIETKRVAGDVWISIADTGPGIAEEAMKHVFDRYWQAPQTRRATGAGLGLSIAKGIVEAHGGHIWVEQAPSRGAKFTFAIPISQ